MHELELIFGKLKKHLWMIYLVLVLVAIGLFFLNIRPLTFDEAEWVVQAKIIAQTGVPDQIWHPPLYLYILAGFIKLFGTSLMVWRLLGFLFFILNMGVLYLVTRKIFENDAKKDQITLLAVILYTFSPIFFQQSMLLDIDNTIHVTLLLLSMLAIYTALKKGSWWHYMLFSVSIALFLASKLITPIIFLGAIFIYLLISRMWKKILPFIAASLGGVAIFLGLWLVYTSIIGVKFVTVFTTLYSRIATEFSIQQLLNHIKVTTLGLLWNAFWMSLALTVFMVAFIIYKFRDWFNYKKYKKDFSDIPVIFFILMIFFYQMVRPSGIHLKYIYPAYVVILIPLCAWLMSMKDMDLKLSASKIRMSGYILAIFGSILVAAGLAIRFVMKPDYLSIAQRYLVSDHIEPGRFVSGISNIPVTLMLLGVICILIALMMMLINGHDLHRKSRSKGKHDKTFIDRLNKSSMSKFILCIAIINIIYIIIIGDYLLGLIFLNPLILLLSAIPLIILSTLAILGMKRFATSLIILAMSTGVAVLILQSSTSYTKQMSWTNYGERGITEVMEKYKPLCDEGKVFLMRYDIGDTICSTDPYEHEKITVEIIYFDAVAREYKYNGSIDNSSRWYPNFIFYNTPQVAQKTYSQIESQVDYVILDQYSNPTVARDIIKKDFILDEKIGDFEIYKRRP